MSETAALTVAYTARESGDGESRWLRVEQLEPEDESITVAEAAGIIDSLYQIDPCEEGLGGGGEEADEEPPEEERFDAEMASMMRRAGLCDEPEYWTAEIDVLRSHQDPGYVLRSETATVESTTRMRASRRQAVEVSGTTIELAHPYAGGLTGIPTGVSWTVRGSTVNLDRPLHARLRLRYDSEWDRVTLRVPTGTATGADGNSLQAVAGASGGVGLVGPGEIAGGHIARPELPEAAVTVFWGDLAAGCDLHPPAQDDSVGADELRELCNPPGSGGGGGISRDEPTDCWRSVHHYDRCNCSRKTTNEYDREVAAPCDGASSGAHVGSRKQFGGYVYCEGEEDEVNDPEYYEDHCCHPPPGPLPRCRRTYAEYNGGAEIASGPEHWQRIYGPGVTMVAVMPPDGRCGDLITSWEVASKNCCDEVEEMAAATSNPTVITAPGVVELCVTGGRSPRAWRVSAGYTLDNGSTFKRYGGSCEAIIADRNACNNASIEVDDGCSRVTMTLARDNPEGELEITPVDIVISPGSSVSFSVRNAQGDVQWSAGQLRLVSPQGFTSATFEAPDGFCGTDTVTASDACGKIAEATVLSTGGEWVESGGRSCVAPWGGAAPASPGGSCEDVTGAAYTVVQGGIRAWVCVSGPLMFSFADGSVMGCPHKGSCGGAIAEAVDRYGHNVPCGYTGEEMIRNQDGSSLFPCTPGGWYPSECYSLCFNRYFCGAREYANDWSAMSMTVIRTWRWECA